jgi:uncharacterized OB-fold protein
MDIARHWRLQAQRYRLEGEECPGCGRKIFPPRDVCPHCAAAAREPFALSGLGSVYSYTTVFDAPAGYEAQAPYVVAVVELAEGPRLTAQLADVDANQVQIGLPVEMVTRVLRSNGPRGAIEYGYKFRPALASLG